MSIKIAHIINPVCVLKTSDLFLAQPVTFESMRMARDIATAVLEVSLIATMYPEDNSVKPEGFMIAKDLQKEVGNIKSFREYRKLPLINEIFDRLTSVDADYYIYTNVDIALKPYFYITIAKYIDSGLKAFVINRRTISGEYSSPAELPLMMAEAGAEHPGYDCFVFHKSLIPNFNFGNACIGANWIGRVIITNLLAQTEDFKVFENPDLTFHIGDDRSWKTVRFEDYDKHNEAELLKIIQHFKVEESCCNINWLNSFEQFHRSAIEGRNADTITHFDKNMLSPLFESGQDHGAIPQISDCPIFIVGHPRSGTTLIQALLGTQKTLLPTYETHFFDIILKHFNYIDGLLENYNSNELILLIRKYSPMSFRTKSIIENKRTSGIDVKILFEMVIEDNLRYIHETDKLQEVRWIEKTPDHVFFLNKIKELYPKAKVINVVRNPEKVIISRRRNFVWNNEQNWDIKKHASFWNDSINSFISFENVNPEQCICIRLEDLTVEQHKTMRKLCLFLDVKYKRRTLKKHGIIAGKIIHPWESWKTNAKEDVSFALANRFEMTLSGIDTLVLSYLTKNNCERYGYHIDLNPDKEKKKAPDKDVYILLQNNKNGIVELKKRKNDLEWMKQQKEKLDIRIQEVKEKLEDKEKNAQKLREIIDEKNFWLDTLKERLGNAQTHVEKLKSILQKNNINKAVLSVELDEEYNKFDANFVELKEQLRDLSVKNKSLLKENENLSAENMLLSIQSKQDKEEIKTIEQRLMELESKYREQFFKFYKNRTEI